LVPKSACRCRLGPIDSTYAAERGSTGALEMSRLSALLAGRIGQPYSCTPAAGAVLRAAEPPAPAVGAADKSSEATHSAPAVGVSPLTRKTLCDRAPGAPVRGRVDD
jgi:hypothetical protein